MTIRVTNTLTGEREVFEPRGDEVLLYVCGLTVSDPAHLGHARLWIHADVVHRWLEYRGHDVRHVENFTDVNEKIVARIGEMGDDEADVARNNVARTVEDMRALNLRRAEVYPRVSEHVPEIIDLVETLIESGHAYEANGSVYFDTSTFPDYGKLSNQSIEDLEARASGDERAEKRNPTDFALWKAGGVPPETVAEYRHEEAAPPEEASAGAETWDSPWERGRPGWHIECSAMSMTHLGETLDVHMGGQDLVFPHHENEIAQSEAATGERFARYWLHVRLLETEGEKMSSSLGNFWTVRDAVERLGGDVVRTFLLSTAYDSRQTYSEATVDEARERWERLERAYERACEALDGPDAYSKVADGDLRSAVGTATADFEAAMDEDFNTREAIAALLDLARAANRHLDGRDAYDYRGLREAVEAFDRLGGDALGLTFGPDAGEGEVTLAGEVVGLLLEIREREREAGNYQRADEIRDSLEALGVEVEDTDDGPTFRL
ncbi:cysteine--tRNA ligase [Halomarina halobia]|uniref:Cysteine--tRNA ligase n=1 Tax=Halomarina halobia TaxID=3033386 RepID=A0ABD6A5X9_9EURY|nr:cysteine--tRNA ligase [Halomarina sp. PSR21]